MANEIRDFPGRPPNPGGLGERLINGMLHTLGQIVDWWFDNTWGAAEAWVDKVFMPSVREVEAIYKPFWREVAESEGAPPWLRSIAIELSSSPVHAAAAVLAPVLALVIMPFIMGPFVSPWQQLITRRANSTARPSLLSASEAAHALHAGFITEATADIIIGELGYDDTQKAAIKNLAEAGPGLSEIIPLLNRGELTHEKALEYLSWAGLLPATSETLLKLAVVIPNISDLIRMAVRDVWNPGAVEAGQLNSMFPGEVAEWAQKQGLAPEWAQRYWAAHWELPSPSMGFQMLHRGIIDGPELESLLRIADYAPGWVSKIMAISYSPYTRVDIRRMYKSGLLNEQQVLQAHYDIGYDEEHARNLTAFTIADVKAETRDLSRADITDGYAKRLLSRDEAKTFLLSFGYDSDEAEFYLSREDLKTEQARYKEVTDATKAQYVAGLISESDVHSKLGQYNPPGESVEELIRLWDVARQTKVQRPSPAELRLYVRDGIIDEGRFRTEMGGHGYSDEYVTWALMRIRLEIDEQAERDVAKATIPGAGKPKRPSVSQMVTFLKQNIATEAEFRDELAASGFSDDYASWFIASTITAAQEKELKAQHKSGLISDAIFKREMLALNYTQQYVDLYLAGLKKGVA